jgi:hypothetical protein
VRSLRRAYLSGDAEISIAEEVQQLPGYLTGRCDNCAFG